MYAAIVGYTETLKADPLHLSTINETERATVGECASVRVMRESGDNGNKAVNESNKALFSVSPQLHFTY